MNKDKESRLRFSEHVQSIAFNLTLSKRMIGLLQVVRDYGYPGFDDHERWRKMEDATSFSFGNGFVSHQFIKFERALESRGLTVHRFPVNRGEPTVVLSRAGELVCELLVEAGLMAEHAKLRKR